MGLHRFYLRCFFSRIYIDQLSINSVVWALLITQAAIFISSTSIPEKKIKPEDTIRRPIISVIKNPQVMFLLVGCALMVSSHGLLYNFYSIFLKSNNYSNFMIGSLWSIGVICEIFIFLLMPKILKAINVRQVILISLAFAVIRFYLIGAYVDHLIILIFAQILHAATFGSFHVASIHIVEHFFNKDHHARGQSLYNSITYGVGGAIGGLGGGYMIESFGAEMTFSLSALLPLLGFLIIFFGLKDFPKNI